MTQEFNGSGPELFPHSGHVLKTKPSQQWREQFFHTKGSRDSIDFPVHSGLSAGYGRTTYHHIRLVQIPDAKGPYVDASWKY